MDNEMGKVYKKLVSHGFGILVSQLYFNFAELTGWGPNYREMNGFPANIAELNFFQTYLSFYDNPWFNIVTVFLGFSLLYK